MITQEDFAARCAAAAAALALVYAGTPVDQVVASLATVRANLVTELAKAGFGGEVDIGALVDNFVGAVMRRKVEIERTIPGGRSKLN